MGSGTDFGRTTIPAVGEFVTPAANPCACANSEIHSDRTTNAEAWILRRDLIFFM